MQEGAQGTGLNGIGFADGALGGLGLPDEAGVLRFEQEVLRVKLTEFVLHSRLLRSRRRPRGGPCGRGPSASHGAPRAGARTCTGWRMDDYAKGRRSVK